MHNKIDQQEKDSTDSASLLKDPKNINQTTDGNMMTTREDPEAKKKKYIKWGIIGAIILIVVILAIVLPIVLTKGNDNPTPSPTPVPPIPPGENPYVLDEKDVVDATYAFKGVLRGSQASSLESSSFNKLLSTQDEPVNYGVDISTISTGPVNNKFSQNLSFSMGMTKWRVAHFTLTDNDNERYQIPGEAVPQPLDDESMRLDMLGFTYSLSPFSFSFVDPTDTSNVFVTTKDQTLFFLDKYIQMDFKLPSQRLYGLGERVHEFGLTQGTWTMWAIGQNSPYDDGTGRKGVYGVHPFVLVQGKNKNDFFGMFFRNSNFQTPIITFNEDGSTILSYITTGGIIDIYFFIHGTAKEIISSYQSYFGKPNLPPFWSMGWQQASFKWSNQSMVEDVIQKYAENNFPLDTVYLDIPYMNNFEDFTVNTTAFPSLKDLSASLHAKNQSIVVIIDAAVSAEQTDNKYYKLGDDMGVYIKSSISTSADYKDNLISSVWPKKAVFIDWFNANSSNFWSTGLSDLYELVSYDGLWIDMNEPTTFSTGEIVNATMKPTTTPTLEQQFSNFRKARFLLEDEHVEEIQKTYDWYTSFDQKNLDKQDTWKLPFIPLYNTSAKNFDNWTLSLNASNNAINQTQYNVHNLYGHMMSNRTYYYLTSNSSMKDNRPFILTRSSFASTGRYASHWLGDNFRAWEYIKYSIAGVMNMNMFGIPQVGADVCGFFGTARDDEMCTRWIQVAQFYPLARLHYVNDSEPNEPYLMNATYKPLAQKAMFQRYQFLRQLYTCLFEAYKYGGTCFDPLLYYYPQDENVYNDTESTFIFANVLKVTPVLNKLAENQTQQEAYFPQGQWADIYTNELLTGNQTVNLTVTGDINVHQMAGTLLVFQNNSDYSINTTAKLFNEPISIIVNRNENGYAYGSLFLDQGISLTELANNTYEYYQIHFQAGSMQFLLTEGARGTQNHVFDKVRIFNASDLESNMACVLMQNLTTVSLQNQYDSSTKTIDFYNDNQNEIRFHDIHSIYFANDLAETPCAIGQNNYKLSEDPDLSSNNVTFNLTHSTGALPDVSVKLQLLSNNIVNIRWTWLNDDNDKRDVFDVPQEIIMTENLTLSSQPLSDYVMISGKDFPLVINVTDRSKNTVFSVVDLIYDEYFNLVKTRAFTSKGVFGLGDRANNDFFFKDGVYGMWTLDSLTPNETGQYPGHNMYGVNPIYMYKQASSSWIGVYHKVAQGQDWWIKNNLGAGYVELSQIAIGGIMDIYVMQGTTPDKVVGQYFTIIGNPVLVPQWTLGWNQCRWGYRNTDDLKAVVSGYENYSIPLDVQWSDIDYLNAYRNFEFDQVNFKDLPTFIDDLHKKNMKYVPILDAGLAYRSDGSYPAFKSGVEKDVFMKINNEILIGQVWPNDAAWPDYFADNTVSWWQSNLDDMYGKLAFDGLWEDMNEAANFCKGVCYDKQKVASPVKNKLRYIPTGRDLETKNMPLDAMHANDFQVVDTHNLYGTQMVKATHEWFAKNDRRTFIIERSAFSGAGKYTSRWLGDNEATWWHMARSVSGIMLQNMFGFTLVGGDICGFIGNTTAELCTKWHLVGAFYPFSRNHNNWGQISQEPWVWANSTVNKKNATDVMRDAIKTKYSLIRYYYTNLFKLSQTGNGTFYKPMFFEFPDDDNAYTDIIYNVMLGDSIKLSINPEIQGLATKDYYFPAGLWCALNGTGLTVGDCFTSVGENKTFNAHDTDYQFHIRQGKIVPMQNTFDDTKRFNTSADLQTWPVDFHVLGQPDSVTPTSFYASGIYVNDDGVTLNYTNKYNEYLITASQSASAFTVTFSNLTVATESKSETANCSSINQNDYLSKIYFYNGKNFNLNTDKTVKAYIYPDEATLVDVGKAVYDSATDRLVFTVDYNSQSSICISTIKQLQFN